jgi:diadenylate cyclase
VLPLAETLPGVGRMGTRHRAAMGLTLQCDAVVLIVSEETGLLSIASDGKIYRGLDQAALREMLSMLLGTTAEHPRRQMLRPLSRVSALRPLGRRAPP